MELKEHQVKNVIIKNEKLYLIIVNHNMFWTLSPRHLINMLLIQVNRNKSRLAPEGEKAVYLNEAKRRSHRYHIESILLTQSVPARHDSLLCDTKRRRASPLIQWQRSNSLKKLVYTTVCTTEASNA